MSLIGYLKLDDNTPNTYRIDFDPAVGIHGELELEENPVLELSIDAKNASAAALKEMLDYFCKNPQYLSNLENINLINFSFEHHTPHFYQFLEMLKTSIAQVRFHNSDMSVGLSHYFSNEYIPASKINFLSFHNITNFKTLHVDTRNTIIQNLAACLATKNIYFQNFYIKDTALSDTEATQLIRAALFSQTLTYFEIPQLHDYMPSNLLHLNLSANAVKFDLHEKFLMELQSFRESWHYVKEDFESALLEPEFAAVDNKLITTLFEQKTQSMQEDFNSIKKILLDTPSPIEISPLSSLKMK